MSRGNVAVVPAAGKAAPALPPTALLVYLTYPAPSPALQVTLLCGKREHLAHVAEPSR